MADASQQVKEWGRYAVLRRRDDTRVIDVGVRQYMLGIDTPDVGAALAALSEEDLPAPRSTSGIATRANRGRPHRRHGPSMNCRTC